jgi:hypothetical protein
MLVTRIIPDILVFQLVGVSAFQKVGSLFAKKPV